MVQNKEGRKLSAIAQKIAPAFGKRKKKPKSKTRHHLTRTECREAAIAGPDFSSSPYHSQRVFLLFASFSPAGVHVESGVALAGSCSLQSGPGCCTPTPEKTKRRGDKLLNASGCSREGKGRSRHRSRRRTRCTVLENSCLPWGGLARSLYLFWGGGGGEVGTTGRQKDRTKWYSQWW